MDNVFIAVIITLESILILLSFLLKHIKLLTILIFTILSLLSIYLLVNNRDRTIFTTSTIESIRINQRREFYASELGKLYKNRIGIYYFDNLNIAFSKISNNFFSSMDLSKYFSPAFDKTGKYPLFLAPLFTLGIVVFLTNIKKVTLFYLLIAISIGSFINPGSKLASVLILPFINFCTALGVITALKFIKRKV